MAPTLYMLHASPSVRAVLMTARAIGLELDEREVDVIGGEHLRQYFGNFWFQLNPQHTIPTLVDDDGFVIWDSHAIMTYLVSKYAKNDDLYPRDLKKRAIVDQRLYFESGVVFPSMLRITRPILFDGKTTMDQVDIDNMIETYSFLESFLEGKKFAAGDVVTIADYSLVATISSIATLVPISTEKFPRVSAWMERIQQLPEYGANKKGLEENAVLFKTKLGIL